MTAKPIAPSFRAAWKCAVLLALAAGAALTAPRAQASDVQVRVLVDVADLIFRSGHPYYYERGHYHPVVIEYDPWRRPVYYRYVPRPVVIHAPPPRYVVAPPPRYYAPPPPHYRTGYGHRAGYGYNGGYDRRGHGHRPPPRQHRPGHAHGRGGGHWPGRGGH